MRHRLFSYLKWLLSCTFIVFLVMYFHWQADETADIEAFYRLAARYFLLFSGLSLMTTLGVFAMALNRYMLIGSNRYDEISLLIQDRRYLTILGVKFCLLSWGVSGLIFLVSYIPYF